MSNKEFVEELVNSLNKINRDPIRFREVDEVRRNQMFIVEESIYSVPSANKGTLKVVTVSLKIDTENMTYPLVDVTYAFSSGEDYDLDMVYERLKQKILAYLLFAEEFVGMVGDGTQAVCIPIRQIIVEGYGNARKRIINESE